MVNQIGRVLSRLSGVAPLRYSSALDHDVLWQELQAASPGMPATALILYDATPSLPEIPAPANFRPDYWLTPWDWALAMSIRYAARPQLMPPGGFRCLIVDLLPASIGRGGRRRFKTAGAFAPWIRWYRPGSERSLSFSFDRLASDLQRIQTLPLLSATSSQELDMAGLANAWSSVFAAPTDRHTIANLVGPLVLAEGVSRATGATPALPNVPSIVRLRTLIQIAGFSIDHDGKGNAVVPLIDDPALAASSALTPHIRFGLVDDQYELGYHDVVTTLLLGDKGHGAVDSDSRVDTAGDQHQRVTLRSRKTPTHLIGAVRGALSACADWSRPRVLDSSIGDVLYLDLRLFGDSKAGVISPRESAFIDSVLDLAEQFRCDLAGDEELNTALGMLRERRANGSMAPQTLAALPLLLCRVDPSLPIVLFSSSQQREVLHSLRHRRNVVTTFSKPFSSGYSVRDAAQESTERLTAANLEALRLHRVRRVWLSIVEFERALGDGFSIHEPDLLLRGERPLRIEIDRSIVPILIDEYQRVLLHGQYADALMLPHNLLESAGFPAREIKQPDLLQNLEILALNAYRRSDEDWYALASRALADPGIASRTGVTLSRALELNKPPGGDQRADAVRGAFNRLIKHLTERAPREGDFASTFRQTHSRDAALLLAYGSLENIINSALADLFARAHDEARVSELDRSAIASYQFYSVLMAMRNARSHYLCRPQDHDARLESQACWTWRWFLGGLTAFARGERPVMPGAGTVDDLITAKLSHWLPSSTLPADRDGPRYCDHIAAAVIQLQKCDLIRLSSTMPTPHWIHPA